MKINKLATYLIFGLGIQSLSYSQCEISASANPQQIFCGQSSTLTAFGIGAGTVVLSENFNSGGFGPGWSSTPGSVNFSNPCSPNGVDNTPHAWMGSNTSVPRTLTSAPFNLSAATAGVTICFDLLYATQDGAAPCEGPDEPDEGVYLQYSINGGSTWITIDYFDPQGGYNTPYTSWNNWCFQIPAAAITSSTMFRWHQTADSGAGFDHWGIDNVQIVQNDINAEVVWGTPGDSYYHSYGVGSAGGVNPNSVSPTTTTTYNVQITTGTGAVCSTSVTVVVVDPIYEVTMNTDPDPAVVCNGDCVEVLGTAIQVIHPGGITTFENNEFESVSGFGLVSIGASVNVNVQGINTSSLTSGMLTEVCINQFNYFLFNFFGPDVTVANFEYKLVAPGGCGEIILIPQNSLQPSSQAGGMQNVCFTLGGATNLSSVSEPYSGNYQPNQPFDNLIGCDPNGVWSIQINAPAGIGLGIGGFSGWSITFDNPPIHEAVSTSWAPTTGVSVPTTPLANPNNINTQICPTATTNYVLTVSNGVAGCATHQETVAISVDQCNGCVNPLVTVSNLTDCAPATLNLANAINPTSDPATTSFHASQLDAENDVSPISSTVSTSGTYWLRAENPTADTCYTVHQIVVTIESQEDASFAFNDFCVGTTNGPTTIATTGGAFAFNPIPSDGATINTTTGVISNGVAGTTYSVEYTTNGSCPDSHIETVTINANPTPTISGNFTYCPGGSAQLNAGSGYTSYLWSNGGATATISTTATTGLTVTVVDANGCTGTSAPVNITESTVSEYHSTASFCTGASIVVHGNTVTAPGVYIDTFAVAGCDSVSIVTVSENSITIPVITGNLWYCEGQSATLTTNPQNYTSYSWSTGATTPTISTTSSNAITVTVTNANGCTATSQPVILVHPPQAILNANPTSGTAPLVVDFTNNSTGATSYDWYFPSIDTFSTTTMNGYTYIYDSLGSYNVILVAHSANCSDTAVVTITVVNPVQPLDVETPNVFTPNGDGVNDFFTFNTSNVAKLELIIVNRWGNLVYKTEDINFMWNGKDMNGRPVTEGVYFFDYKIIGVMGDEKSGHGFVTVEY